MQRLVAIGVVLAALSACSGSDPSADREPTVAPAASLPCADDDHDDQHAVDEAATPESCPTPDAGPTGTSALVDPDEAALRLGGELTGDPQKFADILVTTSDQIVAVDDVRFVLTDPATGTSNLVIAVDTSATTPEERDAVAWAIAFAVADFWGPGGGFRNEEGEVQTAMTLTVDGTTYVAPMSEMTRVYDFAITQTEFVDASRQP